MRNPKEIIFDKKEVICNLMVGISPVDPAPNLAPRDSTKDTYIYLSTHLLPTRLFVLLPPLQKQTSG